MTEAELLPTVVGGALAACSIMFTAGVAALAKLYTDVRALINKQHTDMEFIQKQLDICHHDKEKIYMELVKIGVKI
jgi:hypothetical protein